MVNLLIFDLDGTLVDTREDITASVNYALGTFGMEPKSMEEVTAAVGYGIDKLIDQCIADTPSLKDAGRKGVMHLFRDHYMEHCTDHSRPYPGVRKVLASIGGCQKAVLSNKPELYCRIILKAVDLDNFFSLIVGGDTTPHKKPRPEGILHILEASDAWPGSALMVGDGAPDIIAAREAGIPSVGILGGMGDTGELLEANPDFILESISLLTGFLEKYGKRAPPPHARSPE